MSPDPQRPSSPDSSPSPEMGTRRSRSALVRLWEQGQVWMGRAFAWQSAFQAREALGVTDRGTLARSVRVATRVWRGTDAVAQLSSSLTTTALVSLVPLAAVGLVAARGFGAWEAFRSSVLDPAMAEAGPMRHGLEWLVGLVENAQLTRVGAVGLLILFWTAIRMIAQVEEAFNAIWGVRRPRTWVRRFADYVSVLVVFPLVALAASSLSFAAVGWTGDWLVSLASVAIPPAVLSTGFAFLYVFLPNRAVPWAPALIAGAVGGTAYWIGIKLFVWMQIGLASYDALYSGLAALPLTVVWMQLSWLVVLAGCELSHALARMDEPLEFRGTARLAEVAVEAASLLVMTRVAQAFHRGQPPLDAEGLALATKLPERLLAEALARLSAAHLLYELKGGEEPVWVAANPASTVTVGDIQRAVREVGHGLRADALPPAVAAVAAALDADDAPQVRRRTLAELAELPPTTTHKPEGQPSHVPSTGGSTTGDSEKGGSANSVVKSDAA